MPSGLPPPCGGISSLATPRWLSGQAGTFFPLTTPSAGHKFVLNPCRKAHRNYSLFTILYSLVSPRRNLTPRQTRPTPRDCQGTAPRRGAALICGRNLRFPHKRPLQNAVQGFVIGSVCAAAFFHRGIIPLLTLFFSASGSQKTAVTPLRGRAADAIRPAAPLRGDQFPGDPRWLSGHAGAFFPLTAPPAGHKFVLNPCRKAHRNYSLFTGLAKEESHAPANPPHYPGTPRNCSPQGRSHLLGTIPVPAACVWVWHVRRF